MQTAAVIAIESMRRTVPAYRTKFNFVCDYPSIKRMIYKAAHKYSLSFGISLEDMQAQAHFLYVRALYRFDSTKRTKFSTFLHTVLHNGLITYGKKEIKQDGPERYHGICTEDGEQLDSLVDVADELADRRLALAELYSSLSQDERELVELVLYGFASSVSALKKLALTRLEFSLDQFEEAADGIRMLLGEMQ